MMLFQELFATLRKSPTAMVGLILVAVLILLAVLGPMLAPYDPVATNLRARLKPPDADHWLGTDHLGRDIFSRLLYGARLSLGLAVGAVSIGAISGIATGLIIGYVGGWVDSIAMRVIDVLMAFRLILLAIAVIAVLGPSPTNAMIAIGVSFFAAFVRLTRGEVLAAKTQDYVQAVRALGGGSFRILFLHILPNIRGPLIVMATLNLGTAILSEAALSFLGLGPSPPTPSWGLMVKEGLNHLRTAWWVSTIPGGAIMLLVLSFNLLGDGLRDVLDPRTR